MRTKRSTPPALNTTGQVEFGGTDASDATFSVNTRFPGDDAGSATDSHWTSCPPFWSVASPLASESSRTPGRTHGSAGGGGGVGVTALLCGLSPAGLTAVTV